MGRGPGTGPKKEPNRFLQLNLDSSKDRIASALLVVENPKQMKNETTKLYTGEKEIEELGFHSGS